MLNYRFPEQTEKRIRDSAQLPFQLSNPLLTLKPAKRGLKIVEKKAKPENPTFIGVFKT